MNTVFEREERQFRRPILSRNENSVLEINQHPSCVYVLILDSEADSEEGERKHDPVLPGWTVQNASGMEPEVKHGIWPFPIERPLEEAARRASVRLLSTWDVGAEEREGAITAADYAFVSKTKRCADLHFLLNESTVVDKYWGTGFIGIAGQYEHTGFNIAVDKNFSLETNLTAHDVYHDVLGLMQTKWKSVEGGSHGMSVSVDVGSISPARMADFIVHSHEYNEQWLGTFADQLHKRLPSVSLAKVLRVWNLTEREAADGFDVSSKTLETWMKEGVPSDRLERLSDLAAATDVLLHYLKVERIPAVVRKPIRRLGGKSLLDFYSEGKTGQILQECRSMFQFENVHR